MMNMELGLGNTLLAGDPRLVDHIVGEVKSQGIFDQFRKECIADVDTKPAYQNLRTRVESSVNSFLSKQTWKADLNKNQLRETLRKHIHEAPYLDAGVERIVDQVVNPKVFSVFMPQIEDVVCKFLGLERPKDRRRNGPCGLKDLLPIDLDPVSPESDKNSLRDVSLDSVDAHQRAEEHPEAAIPKEAPSTSLEPTRKEDAEVEKNAGRNGHANEEASQEVPSKPPSAPPSATPNLNSSSKSDEKVDEEEEDSPMFEPIDIMNLNESHVSNDSHLSGISELTSHRSRSPDFSNDGSRENMDFSNHDSEFSKVSSDSRLSIVTDFGSSNHDSTPFPEPPKDEREKNDRPKDNFKAVREFESGKGANREACGVGKEAPQSEPKIRRSISSKETSRDGMEVSSKEPRDGKDKPKDEPSRSKSSREKDSRKDREREISKRQNSHVESKTEKSSGKSKPKENREVSRSSLEKAKEKESTVRAKESGAAKEVKDLKDMYKEKIRELREKKKDSDKIVKEKDTKLSKEAKDKRDSSREKRDSKDHKIATSKSSEKNSGKNSRVSEKEARVGKSDSREKGKREERRSSKEHRSRSSNADEKIDGKRLSRSERDEKIEKSETKQKSLVQKKDSSGRNSEGKRDSKGELEKDKKRRDEKKAKSKDDHSSMRKNSDDRRSTDRDGSNGSNGKNSQKSGSSLGASSGKPATSSLSKESTNTSNSSSETSDSIDESQIDKSRISIDEKNCREGRETNYWDLDSQAKRLEVGQGEISLPIKKRPLPGDDNAKGEITIKKPKFAKNFQEAKKLMKIRRKMEKEKMRQQRQQLEIVKSESRSESPAEVAAPSLDNDILSVPDEERVQIIEVRDEEDDEPYPEMKSDFTLEERSRIIMGGESIFTSDFPMRQFNAKSTLSVMELSIRQSLQEMITDNKIDETCEPSNSQSSAEPETEVVKEEPDRTSSEAEASTSKDSTKANESEETKISRSSEGIDGNGRKVDEDGRCEEDSKGAEIGCESETVDGSEKMEVVKTMKEEADFEERSKVEEMVEARKEEEKWRPVIVEDEEKMEEPKVEENSRSEFLKGKEKGEESSCEEKLEIVEKGENVETENSKPEIVGKGEKIEKRESEEKSTEETVENKEKIETPKVEGKSGSEIVKDKEKIEGRKLDEKSIAESVKNNEKIETQKSEEKSTSEIETKRGKEEERRSEEKTTPEMTTNREAVEARKSVEKSTSEIVKKPENLDARKSEEKSTPEIVKKPEKIDAQKSEEKSEPEIGKKPEKVDARKSEEKSASEIAKKTKKVKSPKLEEQSTGEIVSKPEVIEPPNAEEKSNQEIVKEHKKMRAPKSDEKSTPEVVKEHKKLRAPKSDEKSTPEIGKEKKNIESSKSNEKSTPEIGKEKKKVETPKSEEIVEGKTEGIEPSISGTSQPRLLADSCNREKKCSPNIDEDAAWQSDDEPCLYFTVDNDRLDRFTKFMKSLESDESPRDKCVAEDETDEAVSSNKIVSSVSKTMAPPLPKRKYSTSPLTDILLNNRNNNNDADKITASISVVDESSSNNVIKKRKIGRPRKEKPNLNLCSQQNLLNGENFVMPLSPESDVSATSEKAPSNPIKDEKSRVAVRGSNQRYTSDDLYKPRPLFASSSRRSRRSNQA